MADEKEPSVLRSVLMQFGWPRPVRIKPVEEYQIGSEEYLDRIAWNFSRVIYPVLITMITSLYLRGSMGNFACLQTELERSGFTYDFDPKFPRQFDEEEKSWLDNNLYWVFIISGWFVFLIFATFCLVYIVKHSLEWIMFYFLYFSVFVFLGVLGGRYLFYWTRSICWNFDWITLCFISANFCAGGLLSIFWKAPRWLNQTYLVLLSALMGHVFQASLPEWALWTLLAALVLWDLFAVLAPCGPLQELIKVAGDRQNELPGLLYDTNPTARGREDPAEMRRKREARNRARNGETTSPENQRGFGWRRRTEPAQESADEGVPANSTFNTPSILGNGANAESTAAAVAAADSAANNARATERRRVADAREASRFLDKHIKLGLGDFVFYSVLVSVSARFGFMAVATSFSGVIAGLCITFMVLVTMHRPLPALPISLTFGIIAHFTTRYSLTPFVGNLLENLLFH